MIAAARIGTETVTYVANAYKYYVAYRLIALQEDDKKKTMGSLGNRRQLARRCKAIP